MTNLTFEEQTEQIVEALLSDVLGLELNFQGDCRGLKYESKKVTEEEAAAGATSSFDPVIIASRLRAIGDEYNRDLDQQVRILAAEMVAGMPDKFGEMVESLSQEWSHHTPGLEYGRAFLAVSVRLFKYLACKVPSVARSTLRTGLISAIAQVRGYIEQRGGWENVEN